MWMPQEQDEAKIVSIPPIFGVGSCWFVRAVYCAPVARECGTSRPAGQQNVRRREIDRCGSNVPPSDRVGAYQRAVSSRFGTAARALGRSAGRTPGAQQSLALGTASRGGSQPIGFARGPSGRGGGSGERVPSRGRDQPQVRRGSEQLGRLVFAGRQGF